nr:malto-oligosyltrehalose synthase [Chloroflexota bacterium]
DRRSVERRHRDKEVLRRQLARHCAERPEAGAAIDAVIAEINADHDALDELLERQNFRLAYWRTAGRDLGYRRFFDVTTLIGLRAEDQRVFADTHALLLRWLAEGVLDGLRIDHPDGLRDPEEYLRRLHAARPDAWIVVEKILESDEELRSSWPVAGTTGYDFLNRVGGLFVDPAGEEPLTTFYADFTGQPTEFRTLTYETKHLVMRDVLGSEVNRLTALFLDVCERHRRHRDYTRHDLHEALREVTACFPVYRTYVRAAAGHVEEADVRYVEAAVERARSNRPDIDPDLLHFLRDLLLLRVTGRLEAELVMRFQQLTGAVMAKGVEDTAFYRFHRLVSLNEVGGDPARFGFPVADFHAACAETAEWWPRAMLSTSTHDTKRSEDVRARINVLSEIPDRWAEAVGRWSAWNESYRRGDLPDRNAEYLFYQTLIGAWPLEVERAVAYMEKATREAKQHTSWTDPNDTYEEALREFVRGALGDMGFVTDLEGFVSGIIAPARVSSVAQTLIKLTAPGVPDIYQGAELWDLSLVDPDNRRPVDHGQRAALLSRLAGAVDPEAVLRGMDEGLPKLWVVRQALRLRARRPEWFGRYGAYEPLEARGTRAGHVVAYARGGGSVTVVPRLVAGLADGWEDTTLALPGMRWRNELTGDDLYAGDVPLGEVLARFPVALLASADDET